MPNSIDSSINEQIQAYATLFKLPAIKNSFSSIADEAAKKNLSYTQFLLKLFEYEYYKFMPPSIPSIN